MSLWRVRRVRKQLGLQLPRRRPRRRRCSTDIRLPSATNANRVRCYDFVHDLFADGRAFRVLCARDEHIRESLDVRLVLSRLTQLYGKLAFIRSHQ